MSELVEKGENLQFLEMKKKTELVLGVFASTREKIQPHDNPTNTILIYFPFPSQTINPKARRLLFLFPKSLTFGNGKIF